MDNKLRERLFNKKKSGIPRGELWISGAVLEESGLRQAQESIVTLSAGLGAELCFFSYTSPVQSIPPGSEEMKLNIKKAHGLGLLCGVTVDGPFQRTVQEHGFTETMRWFYQEEILEEYFAACTAAAAAELAAAEEAGADLLVLCDDIAYNRGLYFSPRQFAGKLLPFYRELRSAVKEAAVGFHSDGNVAAVLDPLVELGFRVFSLEPEAVDPAAVCRALSGDAVLLSGIKAEWLTGPDRPVKRLEKEIVDYIGRLRENCGLILASSCGIVDTRSLDNLREIYRLLEQSFH